MTEPRRPGPIDPKDGRSTRPPLFPAHPTGGSGGPDTSHVDSSERVRGILSGDEPASVRRLAGPAWIFDVIGNPHPAPRPSEQVVEESKTDRRGDGDDSAPRDKGVDTAGGAFTKLRDKAQWFQELPPWALTKTRPPSLVSAPARRKDEGRTPRSISEARSEGMRLRGEYLVPLHITTSRDLPQAVVDAALAGVEDVLRASGQQRDVRRLTPEELDIDACIQRAQRQWGEGEGAFGPQVASRGILSEIYGAEPVGDTRLGIHIVNSDFIGRVLGETDPQGGATLLSVKRIMEFVTPDTLREMGISQKDLGTMQGEEVALAVVRRLAGHEVGHLFGLPSASRSNTEENLGPHCTNLCTMRQAPSIKEWVRFTLEEAKSKVHFCSDCQTDFNNRQLRPLPLPVFYNPSG